ncbi:MAG TPA: hypothetical protein VM142_06840 [Acidimicrobiales bacterium]|nr:hypothetical protein [Acidimicrobiales bacterium]
MWGNDVRRGVLFGITLSAVSLGFAAVAWACTAAPYINVSPPAGAPGTTTTITGGGYSASAVEIKWVTAGSDQVVMSTQTNGPDFAVRMTTGTDWAPGVYYVVASQGGQSSGRASYRVTDEPPVTASSSPNGTSETGGASATSGSTTAGSGSGDASAQTYGVGTRRGEDPAPSGGVTSGDPAGAPAAQGGVDQAQSAEAQRSGAARVSGVAGGATRPSPVAVPAGGAVPAGQAPAPAGTPAAEESLEPSPRTATSDLWGGFATGVDARSAPSLNAPAQNDGVPPQALAIGLTVAGMVSLLGGFALADHQQRRRRLAATTR